LAKRADRQVVIIPLLLLIAMSFTFITGERMALLLVSLGAILVLSALLIEARTYRRRLYIGIAGMTLAGSLMLLISPEMLQRSVLSIGDKLADFSGSDYGRVFSAAWRVWQANFWFGTGFDSYQLVCEQMQLLATSRAPCSHPHNVYLELGAETGLIGLLLFICMLAALYWAALSRLIQARAWLHMSLSLSVLTVSFWPLMGGISLLSNWIAALVWLGVGWVLAISATPLRVQTQQIADPTDSP
jgi:O-antigen ligase